MWQGPALQCKGWRVALHVSWARSLLYRCLWSTRSRFSPLCCNMFLLTHPQLAIKMTKGVWSEAARSAVQFPPSAQYSWKVHSECRRENQGKAAGSYVIHKVLGCYQVQKRLYVIKEKQEAHFNILIFCLLVLFINCNQWYSVSNNTRSIVKQFIIRGQYCKL